MFIVYNDFYCRSLSYRVELVSKKSSKYCEHMNEEDFDMEDEEEGQNSEDVEMKRVKDVAIVPGARGDAGVNAPMCVAEGDGVPLPEFGGSKIEMDGEEFEMIRETDIVSSTVVPDKVKVAIKESLHGEKEIYIYQHLAEIESLSKVEEESTLCLHCGRNFSNHGKLCHASNPVSNSCGWFMAVNQEPEIIPMEKFYYCEKDDCDYKSRLRRDVKSWNNVRKI